MAVWNVDVHGLSVSRVIGSKQFSPHMRHVVRQVLHRFPKGFVQRKPHTPLVSKAKHIEPSGAQSLDSSAKSIGRVVESFPAVVDEGYAVMDTGCQRSAIGLNTLQQLQKFLPSELPIKFLNRKFRFAGIGGETVTNRVAMLPVCFGRRPGVVHAAVLEDTPNAPFLLSLPILKALGAQVHLSNSSLQYHAIGEEGSMFYNQRGQLCLRLFDFQAVPANQPSSRWMPKKIIGDECQVFMLQPEFSDSPSKMEFVSSPVQSNEPKDQLFSGENFHKCKDDLIDRKHSQEGYSGNRQSETVMPEHSYQSGAQIASSVAETPSVSDQSVLCRSVNHGRDDRASWKQESVHQSSGVGLPECGALVSSDQQTPSSASYGNGAQGADQPLSSVDVNPQAGTGNDDARGRDRRNGVNSGLDGQHGSGKEEHGEGQEFQKVAEGQQPEQLRTGLREFRSQLDGKSQSSSIQSQGSGSQQFQPDHGVSLTSGSEMLLRSGASAVDMSQRRDELHEKILPLPQESQRWEPVPVLPVDRKHEVRRVREALRSQCFFQQVQEVQEHKEAVRKHLRQRIQRMRSQRQGHEGLPKEPSNHEHQGDIYGRSGQLRSSVESSWDERSTKYEDLSSMWPGGEDPLSRRQAHSAMDRRDHSEEVRQTTGIQPIDLKPGVRKRILGEIKSKIDALEDEALQTDVHPELPSKIVEELMHLRLVGEVFSPDRFTQRAQQFKLSAGRAFDLQLGDQFLCPKNRKLCMEHVLNEDYGLVVVTPPCTMFSLLQYLGLGRTKESCFQDPGFVQRYQEALTLLKFATVICMIQERRGRYYLFEQPWNALSWKEPCVKRLLNQSSSILVRTDQCMFGQKDQAGRYIRKRTGFLTNNGCVAKALRRTCKNEHKHQQCVGQSQGFARASQAARYTGSLINAVLRAYARYCDVSDNSQIYHMSHVQCDYQCPDGSTQPVQITHTLKAKSGVFSDDESEVSNGLHVDPVDVHFQFVNASSMHQFALDEVAVAETTTSMPALSEIEHQEVQQLSPSQRKAINVELEKAHKGMGHPHHDRFLRILRLGGSSSAVLGLAKMYECSQCKESARPKPWRRAAPPRELSLNQVVGVDTVTIKHHEVNIRCLNIICWGTRYQMIVPLAGEKASDARAAYRTWLKMFGPPQVVKPDLGSEFQGDFLYRCSTDGSEVDPASLESPTQNSITEREGGAFKTMFSKASLDYGPTEDPLEIAELIDVVVMCKNRLTHIGGYSAMHRVFGYTPAMPGDVLKHRDQESNHAHDSLMHLGDITLQKQARMRECAGKAFFASECANAIRRAVASGHRKTDNFEVGQLVYFWSTGHFNKVATRHSAARRPNHAFWHGPCRVVATQYPTSIYIAYQGRLVKAAPEQCRLCSRDEDASCSDVLQKLCATQETLRNRVISGVSDIRGEERPTFPEEHPTGKKRHSSKRPPINPSKFPKTDHQNTPNNPPIHNEPDTPYSPSIAPNPVEIPTDVETEVFDSDQEMLLESLDICEHNIFLNENKVISQTNQQDPSKRTQKEIKLKDLDTQDYERFKQAIQKEWKTNLENGAIKVVAASEAMRIRQHLPHRIMQSRLLHVAKPIDDMSQIEPSQVLNCSPSGVPCKAKTRWVARGDKDPDIFSVCASSPVIHRDTFMMGLQAISSMQWRIHFADFSQAFMQGDTLQREQPLYCEPPERTLLGVPPGCLLEIRKTVYGLVDAPFRWNQHLDSSLQKLGYRPSILDPCLYMLHSNEEVARLEGIIMVATDDLVSGGNPRHQKLMDQLKAQYKFGKWEYDKGRFCGKDLSQKDDFSIFVTQEYYAEQKCQEKIHIPKGVSNEEPCTSQQTQSLREKVGALSWLSKETRVDIAGSVSLLMQAFPCPKISDLKMCNKILKEAKLYKDLGITIRPIPPEKVCIVVSSDAAWANAQDLDGSHKSQAGYVVLSTDRSMLQGHEAVFSMIGWKSHTLKRRTVSTLSAETQGIVESAAVACWYRYLLAELFYKSLVTSNGIDWETMLEPLEFGVVTDAKSVYDALTSSTGVSSSTDKRTAIDLAIIREYLRRHNGCIRWIDGTVQLADSLTKYMAADFLRSVLTRGSYQLRAEYDTLNLRQQARAEKQKRKVNQQ